VDNRSVQEQNYREVVLAKRHADKQGREQDECKNKGKRYEAGGWWLGC
jgi:hypothetical protein